MDQDPQSEGLKAEIDAETEVAEARSVAAGSGVALAGNFINRGLRFVNIWQLARALDPHGLGLYASVTNTVQILSFLAPAGLNSGAIVYGSQFRGSGEQARLKGTLITCLVGGALSCAFVALLYLAASLAWDPDTKDVALAAAMPWGALGVAALGMVLVLTSLLRVARDIVGQTTVLNVHLPIALTLLAGAGVTVIGGATGALIGYGVAHALVCLYAFRLVWRHYGGLITDRSVRAQYDLSTMFRYSVPQALSMMLFRFTQWADIVMLTALSTTDQAGVYRVAASLSLVAAVPAAATQTIFNATAAEYLYLGRTEALDRLLKIVTRWQVVLSGMIFLALMLGQDAIYLVFDEAYGAGKPSLVLLLVGQLVFCVCAPTTAIIAMAERSRLNLANGIAAAVLYTGLNYLFIPRYGALGASLSSMLTFVLWSGWQVAQVRYLFRCWPVTLGSAVLFAAVIGLGLGLHPLLAVLPWWLSGPMAAVITLAFGAAAWRFGRTADDDLVLEPVRKKLGGLLRRFKKKKRA